MNITRIAAAALAAAALILNTAPAHASTPNIGSVDRATAINGQVVAAGWTFDPAATAAAVNIRVTVDGRDFGDAGTGQTRPDVDNAFRITGNHGFTVAFTVPAGQHTVCIDGLSRASSPTSLGCFRLSVLPLATQSQMLAVANLIDPRHTITWTWLTAAPATELGQAMPWQGRVTISSQTPAVNLRSVMLHEWSHVLQYRAVGGDWWKAVQSANVAAGRAATNDYYGLEHQADCMAQSMGATFLGYGCPAAQMPTARAVVAAGRVATR